jgi:hypothetical protein
MSDVETSVSAGEEVIAPSATVTPVSETPAAPQEGAVGKPPPSIDDDLKSVWRKANPQRGDNGRFAAERADAAAPAEENTDQAQSEATEPADAPAIPMPRSWSADATEVWSKVPRAAQEMFVKRDTEANTKISQQGQQLKTYEPVSKLLEQAGEVGTKYGMQGHEVVAEMIRANAYLERDPLSAIRDLADAYEVDLRQLGVTGQAAPESALQAQVHALQQRLRGFEHNQDALAQRESETRTASLQVQVEDFAKDKADFAELEKVIHRQILALKADPETAGMSPLDMLKQAYEEARWASPATRDRVLKESKEKEEKARLEEAKKRAADAKKSQPFMVKSSVANTSVPKTMDDTLTEIARARYRR